MKRRFLTMLFGFCFSLSWCSLLGCGPKKVPTDPTRFDAVHRGSYAYQRLNDGEFAVVAVDVQELDKALTEIGCETQYVCLIDTVGSQYQVLVRLK